MTRSSQGPPTEKRPPAAPARRYVAAVVVTALGVTLSLLAWMRSLEERRFGISNVLASLADEASSAIELQLGHQVNAVRDLAASWNLHGPADDETWSLLARRTMKSNPGIQWIEWVQTDPPRTRRVARDPAAQVEPRVQRWIRAHLQSATADVQERWSDTYDVDVLAPVGPPGGRG